MKKTIIFLTIGLASCQIENQKVYRQQIISGTDTMEMEDVSVDLSKCRASSGHNDTVNKLWILKFENSFRKDVVFVHDTVFIQKGQSKIEAIQLHELFRLFDNYAKLDSTIKTENIQVNYGTGDNIGGDKIIK